MALTHDYITTVKQASQLTGNDVLVGECGGLSAVFKNTAGVIGDYGVALIETEHGVLTFDEKTFIEVLDSFDLESYNLS